MLGLQASFRSSANGEGGRKIMILLKVWTIIFEIPASQSLINWLYLFGISRNGRRSDCVMKMAVMRPFGIEKTLDLMGGQSGDVELEQKRTEVIKQCCSIESVDKAKRWQRRACLDSIVYDSLSMGQPLSKSGMIHATLVAMAQTSSKKNENEQSCLRIGSLSHRDLHRTWRGLIVNEVL